MACPLHGNLWCTCRFGPTTQELEEAAEAGRKLAEEVFGPKERRRGTSDDMLRRVQAERDRAVELLRECIYHVCGDTNEQAQLLERCGTFLASLDGVGK